MGYRSEVCIGMTDDAARLFKTILDHVPQTGEVHSLVEGGLDQGLDSGGSTGYKETNMDCEIRLYWDYVKWYDGYDDVGFITSFLEDCIPEEDYRFVRIGEESDDVEESGDYYDSDIYVQRSISW